LVFEFNRDVLGILLAGSIIIILGLIDDFGVLTPKIKLFGQAISALVLIKSGIYIKLAFLPLVVAIPLSFIWLIAIMNAFNIIDIMDGLSTGVALIAALFLFVVAVINERFLIAILTSILGGSLLGFLKYNFEPAKIYLGDSGSMFIGLILGALAMIGSYTIKNNVACIAPIIILGVPIFDTILVSYIRHRRGMSILKGSPDHFALRLRKWKLNTRQTVILSYATSFFLGINAIVIMFVSNKIALNIIGILIILALIFGYYLKKIDMRL
jgi:UDP-GlcNAc:undecaprenyl-phosphate GlcNAc-1-phosphate transferase